MAHHSLSIQPELAIFEHGYLVRGLPWGLSGKESTCQCSKPGFSLGQEDAMEKEMATHSSILGWKIPWTKEPGELQSMGLQSWTQPSD